jgi:hypothetical protein
MSAAMETISVNDSAFVSPEAALAMFLPYGDRRDLSASETAENERERTFALDAFAKARNSPDGLYDDGDTKVQILRAARQVIKVEPLGDGVLLTLDDGDTAVLPIDQARIIAKKVT